MVADVSSTTTKSSSKVLPPPPSPAKPNRVPLFPAKTDNNGRSMQRRPKTKNVTSRYLSYSDTTNSSSNSLEKMSSTAKMLTKTSVRSLSVSFQGESFALPVSKRNDTPETKKAPAMTGVGSEGSENSENPQTPHLIDKHKWSHRWSSKSRERSFMMMSVDFTNEKMKLNRSEAIESKLERHNVESTYDFESFNQTISESKSNVQGGARAIVVPARFWQETINLLRRVQPLPVSVPIPVPVPVPVSPSLSKNTKHGSKLQQRGLTSSLTSNAGGCNSNLGNTPSILSICADSKRGKMGEKKVEDAQMLRLLHNKHMQWRFANAKADAAMVVQRVAAQKSLYNAWVTISKLWHSIIAKRLQMQQLKQNLKLHCLLKEQMLYLDNWDLTDRDYSISLAGAIMALESTSLCLPVLNGAKADIQDLKDAICSAVDVMEAMAVSLYNFVTKVENVNLMASELSNAMKTECSLLDECKDLLSTLTLLEDCSLRTHTLQLIPSTTTTQRRKMMSF